MSSYWREGLDEAQQAAAWRRDAERLLDAVPTALDSYDGDLRRASASALVAIALELAAVRRELAGVTRATYSAAGP